MVANKYWVSISFSSTLSRFGGLTWNSAIPSNEVWVKLGGDKGGSSFKMNFQVVNVPHPNSIQNTCVFAAFEGQDSKTNLHITIERYQGPVSLLQNNNWRQKSLRIFLSGDYEFLCKLYGLSGASGRHCCLYCTITSEQLKVKPGSRKGSVQSRTLDLLRADHARFMRDGGGDINKAKLYNNVICPFLLDIPLNQV